MDYGLPTKHNMFKQPLDEHAFYSYGVNMSSHNPHKGLSHHCHNDTNTYSSLTFSNRTLTGLLSSPQPFTIGVYFSACSANFWC